MTDLRESTPGGHYARKQILSRSRLIAWSHSRRFQTALDLARGFVGGRILDYGCGDGTFLALLMRGRHAPAHAVGAELSDTLVADCRTRLGNVPNLSFTLISDLVRPEHRGAYDGVVCMEVLEHVVEIDAVLDTLVSLLAPDGRLLVSVPVETGIPLLVKQTVRRLAGWRGIDHYPGTTPYTWRELAAGLFAGARPHVTRPIYHGENGSPFHDHKGFNWMVLRDRLARRLAIDTVVASPLRFLPPQLGSQVWFVASRGRTA